MQFVYHPSAEQESPLHIVVADESNHSFLTVKRVCETSEDWEWVPRCTAYLFNELSHGETDLADKQSTHLPWQAGACTSPMVPTSCSFVLLGSSEEGHTDTCYMEQVMRMYACEVARPGMHAHLSGRKTHRHDDFLLGFRAPSISLKLCFLRMRPTSRFGTGQP